MNSVATHSSLSPPGELPVIHAALLEEVPAQQRWLIDSLWAKSGVGIIGGTPKSCKSWLGLELATAIASGTPALGQFAVKELGTALIYLAEDALHVVRERLTSLALSRKRSLASMDIRVITSPSLRLDLESEREKLTNTIATHKPKLLLLDPFVRLHRIDENQAQEVSPLLDFLRQLQRSFDTAVMVVHHIRKSGATQHGQALRGSGDLHAWGDSNLYLTHHKDTLKLTVEQRAARACDPLFLKLSDEPLHLTLVKAPDEVPVPLSERILSTLRQAGRPMNRGEIRASLKVNNEKLGEALTQLELTDKLKRSPEGWSA